MSTQQDVRVAIVGAGVIGKWHAHVMDEVDGVQLAAVVDIIPERAKSLADSRSVPGFDSLADALEGVDFDAVAICVPSGLHAGIAVDALKAGKHVMIEKPVDIDLDRVDEIEREHTKAGTVLTVVSQHRFDPSTEAVFAAIERGDLGRITSGIASCAWWRSQEYYDSGDWRGTWALDGGGALINQSVHTIDLLLGAMGRATEVFAFADTLAHERVEVEDTAVAVVRFESGALGVIHGTTAAAPGLSARLQIHGDKGSAVIDDDALVTLITKTDDGVTDLASTVPDRSSATGSSEPGALSDAHHDQYRNFLAAIGGDEEIRVGLAEGRAALAIILAVYESARTGKAVKLNE